MQIRTLLSATIVTAVVLASCTTESDNVIFVRQVMAPPANTGTGCTYTADPAQPAISSGTLDLGVTNTYSAQMLVGSNIQRQGTAGVKAESASVIIQGAFVEVLDGSDAVIREAFTTFASGFIDPSSGGNPSFGLAGAQLVDTKAADAIKARVTAANGPVTVRARIRVFGRTVVDTYVESGPFDFPIVACVGCLVSFPADSVDPAKQAAEGKTNCSAALKAGTTTAIPCSAGQDQVLDCRLCQGLDICDPSK